MNHHCVKCKPPLACAQGAQLLTILCLPHHKLRQYYYFITLGCSLLLHKKVKYMDLYSASLRSASNALPFFCKSALISTSQPRRQNWMAAHHGYTLQMKTLFRGWPIMVHDTHTKRRRSEHCETTWYGLVYHVICLFTPPATLDDHSSLGRFRPGCLFPRRGGLPVQRRSPT